MLVSDFMPDLCKFDLTIGFMIVMIVPDSAHNLDYWEPPGESQLRQCAWNGLNE